MNAANVLHVNGAAETTEYVEAVAEILRRVQSERSLTLLEIAEKIDVSLGTISNAANKKAVLNPLYLGRLGKVFGPHTLDPFAKLIGGRLVPLEVSNTRDVLPFIHRAGLKIANITADCRSHFDGAEPVDLIIADPPYGDTSLSWDKHVRGWEPVARHACKPTGSMWVFGSLRFFGTMWNAFKASGWRYAQEIVWEKHNGSSFHDQAGICGRRSPARRPALSHRRSRMTRDSRLKPEGARRGTRLDAKHESAVTRSGNRQNPNDLSSMTPTHKPARRG